MVNTRAKNATTHPGDRHDPQKRKRRTQAEIAKDEEEKSTAKAAKETARKEKIARVAELEEIIAEEDDNDVTPRPNFTQARRPLARTASYAVIPMNFSGNDRLIKGKGSKVKATEPESYQTDASTDVISTDEEEVQLRPKKRVKPPKESFRESVKATRADREHGWKGEERDARASSKTLDEKRKHDSGKISESRTRRSLGDWEIGDDTSPDPAQSKPSKNTTKRSASTLPSLPASTRLTSTIKRNEVPILASSKRTRDAVYSEDEFITISDGGLSDHDETVGPERDAAVLSPPKGKKRLTSAGIVKVEDGVKPLVIKQEKSQSRKTNNNLPSGCLKDGRWAKRFIPTWFWALGFSDDPWAADDDAVVVMLQKIWDAIFGKAIPCTIAVNEPVFAIAEQRACDKWRSLIGKRALAVLETFFNSDEKFKFNNEKRRSYAKKSLANFKFLYCDTTSKNTKHWTGLFRGPLVVQTLAAHFKAIRGAAKVPALVDDPKGNAASPRAAIAMSAAAVERALLLCQETGAISIEDTKRSNKFCALNWSKQTQEYLKAVCALETSKLEDIIREGKECATNEFRALKGQDTGNIEDGPGVRARLVEGTVKEGDSEDEDEDGDEDEDEDDDSSA